MAGFVFRLQNVLDYRAGLADRLQIALAQAGHLPPNAPEYQRGVRYLLETQLSDGSWLVRSRSYPVQPKYFDTGFPHGINQWISAAGTSWACMALALDR